MNGSSIVAAHSNSVRLNTEEEENNRKLNRVQIKLFSICFSLHSFDWLLFVVDGDACVRMCMCMCVYVCACVYMCTSGAAYQIK